jgi:hypothetical protein
MKGTIALVLAVAALVAPSALAQSPVQRIVAQEQARGHDPRVVGAAPRAAASPVQRIVTQERARGRDLALVGVPPTASIQIVEPGGFQWGDAGIGAAFGVALMLLALGATLVVRNGRVRSA